MRDETAIRVAKRFIQASTAQILIDVPATLAARKRYSAFPELVVATFDSSFPLYRIFDGEELTRILATGKITGGQYAVKPEREHGASWGYNVNDVIRGGLQQRGKRLGSELYLAKLDALDMRFAHLDPEVTFDPTGPDKQPATMQKARCHWGLGCSVMDVGVNDVNFYKVNDNGSIDKRTLSELKGEAPPEETPAPPEEERDETWGLKPKDKFVVEKGSRNLGIQTRAPGVIKDVKRRGGEREVLVTLWFHYPRKFPDGRWTRDNLTLYAVHPNRLSDPLIALRNSRGDKVLIRKK